MRRNVVQLATQLGPQQRCPGGRERLQGAQSSRLHRLVAQLSRSSQVVKGGGCKGRPKGRGIQMLSAQAWCDCNGSAQPCMAATATQAAPTCQSPTLKGSHLTQSQHTCRRLARHIQRCCLLAPPSLLPRWPLGAIAVLLRLPAPV